MNRHKDLKKLVAFYLAFSLSCYILYLILYTGNRNDVLSQVLIFFCVDIVFLFFMYYSLMSYLCRKGKRAILIPIVIFSLTFGVATIAILSSLIKSIVMLPALPLVAVPVTVALYFFFYSKHFDEDEYKKEKERKDKAKIVV